MRGRGRGHSWFYVGLAALLVLALGLAWRSALAQKSDTVVRVGWYESPFNITDENGRRSGYAYEYQQELSALTGWTYEYVEGSWPDLLQMLAEGKIDLLSDVSYLKEREGHMLFSSLPMGSEEYYVFAASDATTVTPEDPKTWEGLKVGVNKGSAQEAIFGAWAKNLDISCEVVELTGEEEDNFRKLRRHDIDLYVALGTYATDRLGFPVCAIGSSEFYFAVSTARPDLLRDLNLALARLQDENRDYNQQLVDKYLKPESLSLRLSADERAWLAAHGAVRVGYQDNYLAFCATDPTTGELTGALSDFLDAACERLGSEALSFEARAYPSASAALEGLRSGEVDCVFPANLTGYDGEQQGYYLTPALMSTNMYAVCREDDQRVFTDADRITVAVNADDPNYDMFLVDHFPHWRPIYYQSTPDCLRAVAAGNADCLLISNYRFNNIEKLCADLHLTTRSTDQEMDYCFAVRRDDRELYSVLSKATSAVPTATVSSALSHYLAEDAKLGLVDVLKQHPIAVGATALVVAAAIAYLAWRDVSARRRARAQETLIEATETDEATGLLSWPYFLAYVERAQRAEPERPMDAVVIATTGLTKLGEAGRWDLVDAVLAEIGATLAQATSGGRGLAAHAGAGEAALFLTPREDYAELLDVFQRSLDARCEDASCRLTMGVRPWQPKMDAAELLADARMACRLARRLADRQLCVYDESSVRERAAIEQELLDDLEHAVQAHELEVRYQPILDLSGEAPTLVAAEALVRWRHPRHGMLTPVDFIPLLERYARVGEVDAFVASEVARQVARWRQTLGVSVPVALNISTRDVLDETLAERLARVCADHDLEPETLRLELSEADCVECGERLAPFVRRLAEAGFEVWLDDVGICGAPLRQLSGLAVSGLKIDRSLVQTLNQGEGGAQLIAAIVRAAEGLGLPVVAKGVEREGQLARARELGCTLTQGYLFSRAVTAQKFAESYLDPVAPTDQSVTRA